MTLGAERSLASVLDDEKRFTESLELRQLELANAIQAFGEQNVYVAIPLCRPGTPWPRERQPGRWLNRRSVTRWRYAGQSIRRIARRIDEVRGLAGVAVLRSGRLRAAEPDLLAAYEGLRAHRGPTADETLSAENDLVELYERWKRPDLALRYRTDAGAALARFPGQRRDH